MGAHGSVPLPMKHPIRMVTVDARFHLPVLLLAIWGCMGEFTNHSPPLRTLLRCAIMGWLRFVGNYALIGYVAEKLEA